MHRSLHNEQLCANLHLRSDTNASTAEFWMWSALLLEHYFRTDAERKGGPTWVFGPYLRNANPSASSFLSSGELTAGIEPFKADEAHNKFSWEQFLRLLGSSSNRSFPSKADKLLSIPRQLMAVV